ncbi:hypothetical protein T492DRAFT_865615 [Pavlovales sp. CCMP2436]|nr:hypothetical protein T492DRAFT_865615 [Pavlovales sp. CCMP2436]
MKATSLDAEGPGRALDAGGKPKPATVALRARTRRPSRRRAEQPGRGALDAGVELEPAVAALAPSVAIVSPQTLLSRRLEGVPRTDRALGRGVPAAGRGQPRTPDGASMPSTGAHGARPPPTSEGDTRPIAVCVRVRPLTNDELGRAFADWQAMGGERAELPLAIHPERVVAAMAERRSTAISSPG